MGVNTLPHTLVITKGDHSLLYELLCPGVTDECRAYMECGCPESTYRDEWGGGPWFEWEGETLAHGVEHQHVQGGWWRATDDCWPRFSGLTADTAADLRMNGEPLPPGRYQVNVSYEGPEGEYLKFDLVAGPAS